MAFDVKHIFAWVRENNPNVYVKGPFNVTHLPKGDPDCRLGVKKSSNQEQPDGSKKEKKVSLFGYGTGVAACTDPVYGDVVLAEYTQPFNEGNITSFRPLYRQTVRALEMYPINVAADAAFDAWSVYQCAAIHDGTGAIPLNQHSKTPFARLPDGTPLCPIGLPMHRSRSVQSYLWLSRATLPMSLALSGKDWAYLPTRPIRQRQGLRQRCQLGSGWHPARDP